METRPATLGLAGFPAAWATGWWAFRRRFVLFLILEVLAVGIQVGLESLLGIGLLVDTPARLFAIGAFDSSGLVVGPILLLFVWLTASTIAAQIALDAIDGVKRSLPATVKALKSRLLPVVGWLALSRIIVLVFSLACLIPGILAAIFLAFLPFVAIERKAAPMLTSGRVRSSTHGSIPIVIMQFLAPAVVVVPLIVLGNADEPGPLAATALVIALFTDLCTCGLAALYRSLPDHQIGPGFEAYEGAPPAAEPEPDPWTFDAAAAAVATESTEPRSVEQHLGWNPDWGPAPTGHTPAAPPPPVAPPAFSPTAPPPPQQFPPVPPAPVLYPQVPPPPVQYPPPPPAAPPTPEPGSDPAVQDRPPPDPPVPPTRPRAY